MQTIAPRSVFKNPAGAGIDHPNFAVANDILLVHRKELIGSQRLMHILDPSSRKFSRIEESIAASTYSTPLLVS